MKRFLLGVLCLTLITPLTIHAATPEELAAQIEALLRQVAALQQQVGAGPGGTTATPAPSTQGAGNFQCPQVGRTLKRGQSGADVTRLQQFLALDPSIYPEQQVSGFFGALTEAAVKRFQCKHNIICTGTPASTGYGIVGPRTAALLAQQCVSGTPGAGGTVSGFMRVTPVTGAAPLTVSVEAIMNTAKSCSSITFEVHFGDSSAPTTLTVPANHCNEFRQVVDHVYTSPGTYTISFRSGVHQSTAEVTVTQGSAQVSGSGTLSVSPASGPSPLSVTLSGTRNIKAACSMGSYTLHFGDADSLVLPDSGCSSATFSIMHTYTTPGSYTARLVRDSQTSDTASATITVQGSGSIGGGQFQVTPGDGGDPHRVMAQFSLSSSCGRYDLDWGDSSAHATQPEGSCGSGTATKQITHAYDKAGSYTVTLKRGASLNTTDTVSVVIVD